MGVGIERASREEAARGLADEIGALARACAAEGRRGVLGLAAGRSPRGLYAELVRRHREDGLSLASLAVTSLDEYLGLSPGVDGTFERSLRNELIDHVDIPADAVHLVRVERGEAPSVAARRHEAVLQALGGVDIQLLGLGANGHIAFNEPGARLNSRTRVVALTEATRAANAPEMPPGVAVPREALTMGIGTIREARALRMLVFGQAKSEALRRLVHGPAEAAWPCTWLREHPDLRVYTDLELRADDAGPRPAARVGRA